MGRWTRTGLLLLVALLTSTGAHAVGIVDPALRFKHRRTAHFVIYFHAGEEHLAARLAALVEDVRDEVGRRLGFEPPALTHVVLSDQAELANGWATPLPRNIVFLTAAVPSGADFIGRTDNWLRLVFAHEYTHITHLDLSRGWARVARGVFGRSPFVFPNWLLPQWQIEGLATYQEGRIAGQGRSAAGDFRAIERVAGGTGRLEPLDRVNGGLVGWPAGHAPYAYGLGFHEYLAGRFGDASLGRLARRTAGSVPYLGSRAFRPVFGASLGTLWREYVTEVAEANAPERSVSPAVTRLTRHGQTVVGPRFAQAPCPVCPLEIVYSVRNPDTFPELRLVRADGSGGRALATRYLGDTAGVVGSSVIFDQQELRRNVGVYSDLHLLDLRSGRHRPLSRELRLMDPDVSRAGRIVAVRQRLDRRELVLAGPADAAAIQPDDLIVLASARDEQYASPRWSPDGTRIVAERRRLGALPEVVVVDADTGAVRLTIADRGARIVTPTWRPDGEAIVAAADFGGGPFDLYEFSVAGGAARRLTSTAGAYWPDVSPDGTTLVFAGYGDLGYDLYVAPYLASSSPTRLLGSATPSSVAAPPLDAGRTYTPWRTLLPTSWQPVVLADSLQTRAGALVAGTDVLGWHAYSTDLTWLVDGPPAAGRPAGARPDWRATYAYTRWRPTAYASVSRETSFLRADDEPAPELATVSQRQVQAGVTVPFVHARRSAQVLAAVVQTDNRYTFTDDVRADRSVAARLGAAARTARVYGYSISPEDGVLVGTTLEQAHSGGADGATRTATIDARAYLPGLSRHSVLAVRGTGGVSDGPVGTRRAFQLGGAAGAAGVMDFRAGALGLLRGFSTGQFAGTGVATINVEYRAPLLRVERGVGTWPLFLRWVHGSVFVDAGRVWSDRRPDPRWKSAVGGELSADVVAGFALPITMTVGVAWARDGNTPGPTTVYARLGRAF